MVSKLLKLFRCCANVKNWRMSRRTVGKAIEKGRSKKPESDNVENKKIIGLQTVTSSEKRAKLLIDGKPKRFHGGLHRSLSDENCASCLNSATYAEKNVSSENLVCELHEEKIMDGLVRQDLEDDGRVSRTCESPCEEVDAIVPASAEYISSKDNVDDTEASDQFPFASFDLSDSDEEVSGNAVDYKSGGLENKQEETIYDSKRKRWSLKFTIEKKKVRLVTGRKGAVKRKLEEETGCHLSISRKGKRRCVWITSKSSEENIEDCRNRIDDILSTALVCASGGPKYTHFVSMPMNRCDELRDRFRNFVELVKNDASIHESCKEASLFQIPEKLHLTITMLSLDNEEKRQSAVDRLKLVVEEKVRKLLSGNSLELNVKGLSFLKNDPTKAKVLYACVECESLEHISNAISDAMEDGNISPRREGPTLIHLTLMNTTYLWRSKRKRATMDVTRLIELYGDYDFGRIVVDEIHISSLFQPKDESGFYSSIAVASLS